MSSYFYFYIFWEGGEEGKGSESTFLDSPNLNEIYQSRFWVTSQQKLIITVAKSL